MAKVHFSATSSPGISATRTEKIHAKRPLRTCQPDVAFALIALVFWAGCAGSPPVIHRAAVPSVKIIPRSAWTYEEAATEQLIPIGVVTRITIHGLDEAEVSTPGAGEFEEILRAVRKEQMETRKAGDIFYHYIVDVRGRIWEGRNLRYGGFGAGIGATEVGNISILVWGKFDEEEPTPEQVESLTRLTKVLATKYRIPGKYVFGHSELARSYGLEVRPCPGKNLIPFLEEIRSRLP